MVLSSRFFELFAIIFLLDSFQGAKSRGVGFHVISTTKRVISWGY